MKTCIVAFGGYCEHCGEKVDQSKEGTFYRIVKKLPNYWSDLSAIRSKQYQRPRKPRLFLRWKLPKIRYWDMLACSLEHAIQVCQEDQLIAECTGWSIIRYNSNGQAEDTSLMHQRPESISGTMF